MPTLPIEICRERFADAQVARLATVRPDGTPHQVPVTFALPRPDLIVYAIDHKPKSTTHLRRLDNIRAQPASSFLVDVYDDDWSRLWWVRVDGRSEVLPDGALRTASIDALSVKYRQYREVVPDGVVVGTRITGWSGWAFSAPTGSGG
ncbi:TIGR03668 family PPOX class F420-dependent oxidoreductase [Nakamurella sp. YIM 132087]|uniref:TIGR03668 family PPOX class F420-dependent oxidoreductase n=1 Tax=Nakamurella alba TaxID=2665158 RepID=A0A7K1FRN7_9ACTN|nr:TIGR03668 family PPOX class F420-dependent oxidoreductase [Nakamurella alba]MTD15903.1 TIGR03668 family PPOX class F420-dependent oxidoreductase [Nakamurella alba]